MGHVAELEALEQVQGARLPVLEPAEPGGTVAVAEPAGAPGTFDCRVQEPDGTVLLRLEGYRTVPMPGELTEEVRGPLRTVMTAAPGRTGACAAARPPTRPP